MQKIISITREHHKLATTPNKKLKSKEKNNICLIVNLFEVFRLSSVLFTYLTYAEYYHGNNVEDTSISRVLERFIGGSGTAVKSGKLIRGFELLTCMLPNVESVLIQYDYHYVGISKGEAERYKLNLRDLLQASI